MTKTPSLGFARPGGRHACVCVCVRARVCLCGWIGCVYVGREEVRASVECCACAGACASASVNRPVQGASGVQGAGRQHKQSAREAAATRAGRRAAAGSVPAADSRLAARCALGSWAAGLLGCWERRTRRTTSTAVKQQAAAQRRQSSSGQQQLHARSQLPAAPSAAQLLEAAPQRAHSRRDMEACRHALVPL